VSKIEAGKVFCAKCFKVSCFRHFKASHAKQCRHLICGFLEDLRFYCYGCEGFLDRSYYLDVYRLYEALYVAIFRQKPEEFLGKSKASSMILEKGIKRFSFFDELEGNIVLDRMLGCIYGQALGDAFGLSTEFWKKNQIKAIYPDGKIPFPKFEKTTHSKKWEEGDWTDDTDQMILIMQMLTESGIVDQIEFAKKLKRWVRLGFPELNDTHGSGLGATIGKVVYHDEFLTFPAHAAKDVWLKSGSNLASNGAVMRTSILGIFQFNDLSSVEKNASLLCTTTHYDPRCIASCIIVCRSIAEMLQKEQEEFSDDQIEHIISDSVLHGIMNISHADTHFVDQILSFIKPAELSELKLDEDSSIGFTLKTLACGLFGMRSNLSFKEALTLIALEGGDSDTNGAVCGAMLGAKIGYTNLPKDWLQALPNKMWLDHQVYQFLSHRMEVIPRIPGY
jgi:ADP-ribosylglycohydrolase